MSCRSDKLDAVVGLQGSVERVNGADRLTRVGITCALCHSTVDNSFAPGIAKRLDGWPNRDLNPGAIIALSPALDATTKAVFNSWGPGKYDPRFNTDGLNKPAVIPPAYGLAGIHSVTFTGDGEELAYWNRYVAVTQTGGQGTFTEPRLNLSITNGTQDLVSSKLPALQAYQLSLVAPAAPASRFDAIAAVRGKAVFEGRGQCVTCHSGAGFTDANSTLHPTSDSMAEPESPSYAARSATKLYRTTPLRGVWQHAPYFHDGSAATLEYVGRVYNTKRSLGLSREDISASATSPSTSSRCERRQGRGSAAMLDTSSKSMSSPSALGRSSNLRDPSGAEGPCEQEGEEMSALHLPQEPLGEHHGI